MAIQHQFYIFLPAAFPVSSAFLQQPGRRSLRQSWHLATETSSYDLKCFGLWIQWGLQHYSSLASCLCIIRLTSWAALNIFLINYDICHPHFISWTASWSPHSLPKGRPTQIPTTTAENVLGQTLHSHDKLLFAQASASTKYLTVIQPIFVVMRKKEILPFPFSYN